VASPREYVCGSAVITDPVGLHARPAVKVTKLAKTFAADVQIAAERQEKWVNAKSPSAVMKLKATNGENLLIRANGIDANDAVAALAGLAGLIDRNFES
jgi:phosphocarrier protein HPr